MMLPVIEKGENLIPTIHVCDLAKVTKKLVTDKIEKNYIFAIDRTKKPTQKRLVEAISKDIGTGKIQHLNNDDVADSIIWKDFLTINLKMKTSDVFKDGEPPEDAEDPEEAAKALKFPWHCEKGIIENAKQLNVEFNEARNLNPVKIFITGPPASGKSFYAEKLAAYYNLPHVHVKQLTDQAFSMSKTEEEEGLAFEIKTKLEELRDAAVAKIEEERAEIELPDGEEWPEIDRDGLNIRVPDDIVYNLLKLRLNENDCRNRGYILDGFPRTYEDCQHIFLVKTKKINPETGEEEEEEDEPELEEGQKKSFKDYVIDSSISASSCIVFKQDDKFLIDRVKDLTEAEISGTHYNIKDMKRRLEAYRKANESEVAEPSVQDFFKEHGVKLFEKDSKLDRATVIESLKIYIERVEKPNNFMLNDESLEAKRRILV